MKSSSTSDKIMREVARTIKREMACISSSDHDSILRDNVEAVKNFSWDTVTLELQSKVPTLMLLLRSLVHNPSRSSGSRANFFYYLQIVWQRLLSKNSTSEKGTMCQIRNLLHRSAVPIDPQTNMKAAEDFLLLLLHAHTVAAAKELLSYQLTEAEPPSLSFVAKSIIRGQ